MTLREKAAIVSATLVIVGTIWYIYLALSGRKVKPVLAAWIVNSVGTILSFTTYWTAPKHSLVSAVYNLTSILTINSILVAAIILTMRKKEGLHFPPFHKKCLLASFLIATFWVVLVWGFGRTGIIPNVLIQVMMAIGYFVIGERLWRSEKNTESLFAWWCIVLASMAGMIPAGISHDWLAVLFAGRTFVGALILVLIMHRAERKAKLAIK